MSSSAKSFRQGPLLVWNGQDGIADVANEAGQYHNEENREFGLKNMFDENPNTCWISENKDGPHTIKIFFKVSLEERKIWDIKDDTDPNRQNKK